jgi:hypothetical protein
MLKKIVESVIFLLLYGLGLWGIADLIFVLQTGAHNPEALQIAALKILGAIAGIYVLAEYVRKH